MIPIKKKGGSGGGTEEWCRAHAMRGEKSRPPSGEWTKFPGRRLEKPLIRKGGGGNQRKKKAMSPLRLGQGGNERPRVAFSNVLASGEIVDQWIGLTKLNLTKGGGRQRKLTAGDKSSGEGRTGLFARLKEQKKKWVWGITRGNDLFPRKGGGPKWVWGS